MQMASVKQLCYTPNLTGRYAYQWSLDEEIPINLINPNS